MAGRFAAVPVLLLTTWSLVGCYAYVPVTSGVPASVGGSVRVTLTSAGSESLRQALGTNVREIEGVVARSTADSLVLSVAQTFTTTRERFASTGDTVAVARRLVESVSVQQYSRKRSIGLGAMIATFVLIAIAGVAASISGSSGSGQPGTSQP